MMVVCYIDDDVRENYEGLYENRVETYIISTATLALRYLFRAPSLCADAASLDRESGCVQSGREPHRHGLQRRAIESGRSPILGRCYR